MQTQGNLFTRPDTFFGICEGIGEDTLIPANLIRIALGVTLYFNPTAAFATYAALGVLVLFTRLLFPAPRRVAAAPAAADPAPVADAAMDEVPEVRLAA